MGGRLGSPLLGIDLRDGGVRGAAVRRAGQSWEIQSWTEIPATEQETEAGALLKKLVEQVRPTTRRVAVALGFQHVLARRLKFPRLPLAKLRRLVERDGERYIPFYNEGANFDLQVLDPGARDRQMEVLLTAVPARLVQPLLEACQAAGLRLAAVEVDLVALQRAALIGAPGDAAGATAPAAVLEVAGQTVRMGLFQGSALLSGRGLSLAGQNTPELAVEVRRSLEVLFSQQPVEGRLGSLVLVGDAPEGGLDQALLPVLQADLGHRLAPGFAIRTLALPGAGAGPAAAVAFGAALTRAAAPLGCHLLPRLTWVERRRRRNRRLLALAGLAALGAYGWYWSQAVPQAEQRIALAETNIRASEEVLRRKPEVERLEARRRELDSVIADLRVVDAPLHEVIPAIADLAPFGLRLHDWSVEVPGINLKGAAANPALVVELLGRLHGSPYVAAVELRSVTAAATGEFNFDLTVTLKGQKRGAASSAAPEKP